MKNTHGEEILQLLYKSKSEHKFPKEGLRWKSMENEKVNTS